MKTIKRIPSNVQLFIDITAGFVNDADNPGDEAENLDTLVALSGNAVLKAALDAVSSSDCGYTELQFLMKNALEAAWERAMAKAAKAAARKREADRLWPEIYPDVERRDTLVFGSLQPWHNKDQCFGGIKHFDGLDYKTLHTLLCESLMTSDTRRDDYAPTAMEYCDFMEKYPNVTAHGYCVSPHRRDYNVELEGLEYKGLVTDEMELALRRLCPKGADTFTITKRGFRVWFD